MTDDKAGGAGPEDVREKFRAALERKKSASAGGGPKAGPSTGKASRATSNQKTHREFRRKSGG